VINSRLGLFDLFLISFPSHIAEKINKKFASTDTNDLPHVNQLQLIEYNCIHPPNIFDGWED
jgi:hypothetical protein